MESDDEQEEEQVVGGAVEMEQRRNRNVSSDQPRVTRPGDRPEERTGDDGHDRLWNIADVAAYLQIPVSSIYKMTARKAAVRIPHIRIGGKLRFRRAEIDHWLTLLTISNIKALSTMRLKTLQVNHGEHSQAQAP